MRNCILLMDVLVGSMQHLQVSTFLYTQNQFFSNLNKKGKVVIIGSQMGNRPFCILSNSSKPTVITWGGVLLPH